MQPSASVCEARWPLASTHLSHADAYVLSLATLPTSYAASASSPSHKIDLFDKSSLRLIQSLPGHHVATTSVRAVDHILGAPTRTLISTGKDGSVKIWDERSGSHSIKLTSLGNTSLGLLSCDASPTGDLIAAGSEFQGQDSFILYWDPRQPAVPIRTHSSTHSDDITTLSFHPSAFSPPLLLSGSSDGLLSISNAIEDDEDETVIHVGAWGPSVSQSGWYTHPDNNTSLGIWAASDMETFSLWSDQLDQRYSVDIRNPSVHTTTRTWVTDYLISCYPSNNGGIKVYTGSNEGDAALISPPTLSSPTNALGNWTLHSLWTGNHIGIVRSILPDEENKVIITGGEDGKIHLWKDDSLFDMVGMVDIQDDMDDQDVDMDMDTHLDRSTGMRNGRKRERDEGEESAGKKARFYREG
ncbi:hypothetical protein AGABI1DRAFT_126452 [Agaricus bisporus var. burnettii JB137-S8]|uniref:WD40 repeat-like protein n=1 Tax=Agaricus bisporus var. burnettii (strain JB137-S8 / ATCC MYA-4627 / FGSC 10392) TaxID=597362 RepID=K5W5N5_AGABU|nr:uncharacterized protein AGABI1DRAFT_126452 [Agaricus bisporus var. burnettii JB137-S8]EKM82104.1 hypothetical protein AGABI1DRAFT_126452 [Agaricus bisporus var. burnettii JB137-S8]